MKIHHLNCGSMCPIGGAFWDGTSKTLHGELVCHCLAIETGTGLVLVDTGFGIQDVKHPYPRLSPFFKNFNNVQLDPQKTALAQIERLGFSAFDVEHIILTHLDFDHAGGISDFPRARVHLLGTELNVARHARTWKERNRYRHWQWDKNTHWVTYDAQGEKWFDFDCVRQLNGLPPEILLIPLTGHTWGHAGVAVRTQKGWLLHAGDAYFYHGEMDTEKYRCTPGLRFYQTFMEVDRDQRLLNQHRLRDLVQKHTGEVEVFSAHDKHELESLMSGPQALLHKSHARSFGIHEAGIDDLIP